MCARVCVLLWNDCREALHVELGKLDTEDGYLAELKRRTTSFCASYSQSNFSNVTDNYLNRTAYKVWPCHTEQRS